MKKGYRIFFSNLGYAKGINGSFGHHLRGVSRHFYCPPSVQIKTLLQLKEIINREQPDLCCFVEIDEGKSPGSGFLNQLEAIMDENYPFHDIAGKYGEESSLSRLPLHKGKCNAFIARNALPFERKYFSTGGKKLFYKIDISSTIQVVFAHFSLKRLIRVRQFEEVMLLIAESEKQTVLLGDFNILSGFGELSPFLEEGGMVLMNDKDIPTFTFHRRQMVLDLCICAVSLRDRIKLDVVEQPFSDHAALLVEIV